MFRFYTGFILILYFTLSMTIDLNETLSNSNLNNHEVVSIKKPDTDNLIKKYQQQVFNEHLKIIIIIGSISVGIMIIIVIIFITIQHVRHKRRNIQETIEQTQPLNKSKQKIRKTKLVSTTTT